MWAADGLGLTSGVRGISTKALVEVVGGAASGLELLKLTLVLQDDGCSLVAITPASVANLPEGKVEICARDTHPITHALGVVLLLLSGQSLLAHCRGENWSWHSLGVLGLGWLERGQRHAGGLFNQFVFIWGLALELDVSGLLHRGVLGRLVAQKMLGLAVHVLSGLLLLAAVALLTAEEVVVLAAAADPATIREIKFVFVVRVLLLVFANRFWHTDLFGLNLDSVYFVYRGILLGVLEKSKTGKVLGLLHDKLFGFELSWRRFEIRYLLCRLLAVWARLAWGRMVIDDGY